jgi:integral membrane protein (TIGR01906 family)
VRTTLGRFGDIWIGVATALAIVALTIPLFMNPLWVGFEQGRAQATAWTGYSTAQLAEATNALLADLVFGPPEFAATVGGTAVLDDRERAHMRDVRGVFAGFYALAIIASIGAIAFAARRRGGERRASWRAARVGALGLIGGLFLGGAIALVAFDALFETFHRLFFAGGSYTFDPTTDKLVQLFPFQFWQETAIAVGLVSILIAGIVAAIATVRLEERAATVASRAAVGDPHS